MILSYEKKKGMREMEQVRKRMLLQVAAALLAALVSLFVVSKYAASPEFHQGTLASLDEKRATVMELTAASTAASAAITLLPGDTATPIADKLADLSGYFLVVLCAIYLEKYLVTITGCAAFQILIPLACLLWAVYAVSGRDAWKRLAAKLLAFGLAICLVIPASVGVSNLIEDTYAASIQTTIASAKESTDLIEEDSAAQEPEDSGLLSGLISQAGKLKDGIASAGEKVEQVLNNFIEALAVMLVTSCVIPILVLLFFLWITKLLLGVDLPRRGH